VAAILFVTHPEVMIDPKVPVLEWPLSEQGRARMEAFASDPVLRRVRAIYTSGERKAIDGAGILASHLSVPFTVDEALGENDRSATGYIAPPEFEAVADAFFARPDETVRGWERAMDAQHRILGAVDRALSMIRTEGDVAIISHGGVGTLLLCRLKGVPINRREDQPGGGGGHVFSFDAADRRLLSGWRRIED